MSVVGFRTDTCVGPEVQRANMASALARNLPGLMPGLPRPGKLAIIGSGPSVASQLEVIRNWDGEVWAVNGALKWLQDNGIDVPVFVGLDPKRYPALKHVERRLPVKYYLASTMHPDVFDRLEGLDIQIWHSHYGEVMPPSGCPVVPGGPTVLTRAPLLAQMMGWREVHLFGCDGSFGETTHVYGGELPDGCIKVEAGGRVFITRNDYMQSAAWLCWFKDAYEEETGGILEFHGDGLTQTLAYAEQQDSKALLGEEKPRNEYLVAKEAIPTGDTADGRSP